MADYRITIVTDEGKIENRTTKGNPDNYETTIIALELNKIHPNTPFMQLIDIAENHSHAMGFQRAMVDEDRTIIVTRKH